MRRTKIVLLCCLAGLLMTTIFASVSTFTYRQSIIIHASIYDVANQFNNFQNWKHWYTAFAKEDTTLFRVSFNKNQQEILFLDNKKYTIDILNPAQIIIYKTEEGKTISSSLIAVPYKNSSSTYVEWIQKMPGYKLMKKKLFIHDDIKENLDNLKKFMEDDSHRYGFFIKMVSVADTLILTRRVKVMSDKLKENIPIFLNELQNYIKLNNIPAVNNYYYMSVTATDENRSELAVGIPVHKILSQVTDLEFLRLPAMGRLLTGVYQGTYIGREKLYTAMDKYISDKRLKKVAQPLEKYNITDTNFTDDSKVSMTLFYPIY